MNLKQKTAELIRSTRKAKGLTQKDLALKMGIGEPTINHYESGRQNLTVDTISKLGDALGVEFAIICK